MVVKPRPAVGLERAPSLPDRWRLVRFDQMAECVTDRVDNPAEAGVERYVGLEHLDPESLRIRRWGSPTDVEATKLCFKPGDIIFGRRRAYQHKLAVADFEGICSAHAMVLRAREDVVIKEFLPLLMQSDLFFDRALAISVGSLSPTINWRTLARQEFPLPSKDEQRRIAEILWATDEVYEKWLLVAEELIGVRRSIVGALMRNLVGGTLAIGEVARLITSGSRGWAKYYSDSGSIFIRVANLKRDSVALDLSDVQYVQPPSDSEGLRTRVMPGDLLISITADLGRIAVAEQDVPESYVNQHVALVRLKGDNVDPYFAAYCLSSKFGLRQFQAFNDAGAKAGMNLKNVGRLRIPRLPLGEQRTHAIKIAEVDCEVRRVEASLGLQRRLRRELIARHVTPAND